jgi:hypothetical protein
MLLLLTGPSLDAAGAPRAKRVLMLFSESKFAGGNILVEQGARDVLQQSGHPAELYAEYLDAGRFPEESNYTEAQAAFAMRAGQSSLSMRNAKGVTVVILQEEGKESDTRSTLGPSGLTLKLK